MIPPFDKLPPLVTPPTPEDLATSHARREAAKRWLKKYSQDLLGLSCFALVVTGIWALAGWAWASIAAGAPGTAFYLVGEFRRRD